MSKSKIKNSSREKTKRVIRSALSDGSDSSGALLVVDLEKERVVDANAAAADLSGYSLRKLLQKPWKDFHLAGVTGESWDELYKELSLHRVFRFEGRFKRQNNTYVNVEVSLELINIEGDFFCIVQLHDTRSEGHYNRQLRFFQNIMNRTKELVVIVDPQNGSILYVNYTFCRILGYPLAQLRGQPIRTIDIDLNKKSWDELLRGLEKSKFEQFSTRIETREGRVFPVEVHVSLAKFGDQDYMMAFATDITEREKVLTDLKNQSELLSNLVVGIHLISAETGEIVYCNHRLEEMFGYESGEITGKHVSILNAPGDEPPEERARKIIDELKQRGSWSGEIHNIKKDGRTFWCHAGVTSYEHPEYGAVWLSTHIDITERKLLSDALVFVNQKSGLQVGYNYFNELALYLGNTLGLEYVFIDELLDPETARTLAIYNHGEITENLDYKLEHTPCENVMKGELCTYRSKIQQLFPRDELLVAMEAECYIGIPLHNTRGETIGLIALIGKSPLENEKMTQDLLQIVSIRAAAEIERIRAEQKMRESMERYRAIADYTYDWENWMDPENRLLWVNPAVSRLTGYSVEECFQMKSYPLPMVYKEDKPIVKRYLDDAYREKTGDDLSFRIVTSTGELRWMAVSWQPFYDLQGEHLGHRSSIRDVTRRKNVEHGLQTSYDTLLTVLESLDAQVYVSDMHTHEILFINRKLRNDVGDVVGQTCWKVMRKSMKGPCDDCTIPLLEQGVGGDSVHVWERFNRGQNRWYQLRDRAIEWIDGRKVRLEIATDITKLKEVENQYEVLSYIDHLTGVGNRRSFDKIYRNEWERCRRSKKPIAMIMADIDYFKAYNDSYGHLEGDATLRRIARLINHVLNRPGDIVSRYGGEEFVISLAETPIEGAALIAEKLRSIVEDEMITHSNSSVASVVTISLGVSAVVPGKGDDPDELLERADQALYEAKGRGRNRVVVKPF